MPLPFCFPCLASRGRLSIPLDASADRPTVQGQKRDRDSLYHQVKRLIAIRQAHQALQNRGTISFVHVPKNGYPLVYLREAEGEMILVILNPSSQTVSFPWKGRPGKRLFGLGGEGLFERGIVTVPPCFAGFYQVEK